MLNVLIFYSEKDQEACDEFKTWLRSEKQISVINDWHLIPVGQNTKAVRKAMIESAHLVVMLCSQDFLVDEEGLPYLQKEGLPFPEHPFSIQVRHSNYKNTILKDFEPANDIPLPEKNRDAAWQSIHDKLAKVLVGISTPAKSENPQANQKAADTPPPPSRNKPTRGDAPPPSRNEPTRDDAPPLNVDHATPLPHDIEEPKPPTLLIIYCFVLTALIFILGWEIVTKSPVPEITSNQLAYAAIALTLMIILSGFTYRTLSRKTTQSFYVTIYGSPVVASILTFIAIFSLIYLLIPIDREPPLTTPTAIVSGLTETPESTPIIDVTETTDTPLPTEEQTDLPTPTEEIIDTVAPTDEITNTPSITVTTSTPITVTPPTAPPTTVTPLTPSATTPPTPSCPIEMGGRLLDCEVVTRRDYLSFVTANGYTTARYWVDATAVAWAAQQPSINQASMQNDTPFLGTWYEAAAYCEYMGKRLPTDSEWNMAYGSYSSLFVLPNDGEWLSGPPYRWVSLANGLAVYEETAAPGNAFVLEAFRCIAR